jgi:hypothetical protein
VAVLPGEFDRPYCGGTQRLGHYRNESVRAWLSAIAAAMAVIAVWLSSCGGALLPYLDDAGVYHAADGAVLFVPGSACVGFDASHVADPPPACDVSPDAALDDAGAPISCEAWPSVPSGFPVNISGCAPDTTDAGGHCIAEGDKPLFAQCPSIDALGDTYCQAWAQQFVVVGQAVAKCLYNNPGLFGSELICDFEGTATLDECVQSTMLITGTDAAANPVTGVVCRFPCQR